MVFTPEQDAYILMAHYRSGTRHDDGSWSYSLQFCFEQFMEAFPDVNPDYDVFRHHKYLIVKRFEDKHCICKGKSTGRPTVLTQAVVENLQERIEQSPKKSVAKLSGQAGLSIGTCHKALKKVLHMHPYKVSLVQQLHAPDYNLRIRYCQWFNQNLNNNEVLDRTFFTDEAWVYLSGHVNSQNYRTWATVNPHLAEEVPLHPEKIGIWLAISRRRIIGPIFFRETITSERYCNILQEAFDQMHDDELQLGYFQQDGATAHTANATTRYLEEFFPGRIISRDLWPPRSPDLTPLDFYFFGRIKNNIFKNRIHTIQELEAAIINEVEGVTQEELQRVFENMKRRVNICLANEGGHFEHFL